MTIDNELITKAIKYMDNKTCATKNDLKYLDSIYKQLKNEDSKTFFSLIADNLCLD